MTTITNTPYSYYNVLNPSSPLLSPKPSTTPVLDSILGGQTQQSTQVTQLGNVGVSPEVIALLQTFQPGSDSDDTVTSLTGSSLLKGTLRGNISTNAYQNIVQTAYNAAIQRAANIATTANPVQDVVASANSASNSYNTTLIEQAKKTLAEIQANPLIA